MLPSHLMTTTVSIEYAGEAGIDRYNRPVRGDSEIVEVPAYYRPRRTDTTVNKGELITAAMQLFLQPSVDLTDAIAVHVDGRRYSIDGQPQTHWNPLSKQIQYHVVLLRRGTSETV